MSVSWKKISSVLIFLNIVLEQFCGNSLPMIFNGDNFVTSSDLLEVCTLWVPLLFISVSVDIDDVFDPIICSAFYPRQDGKWTVAHLVWATLWQPCAADWCASIRVPSGRGNSWNFVTHNFLGLESRMENNPTLLYLICEVSTGNVRWNEGS